MMRTINFANKEMSISKKNKQSLNQLGLPLKMLNYLMLLLIFITMVAPMINVVAVSFSTKIGSMEPGIKLLPDHFSVEGYIDIWQRVQLWRPFYNSVIVTSISTFFQVFLSAMAGYVLIQEELPFKKSLTSVILITMMVPADLTLISLYVVNKSLGLLNTYTGLIVNGLISGFSILLMRNYFLAVPNSLAESARMDGAGEFTIFNRIYLPMSIPALATLSFLEFVRKWNSLLIPSTIVSQQEKYTLPVILKMLVFTDASQSGTGFIAPNAVMAAIVISVIPLIVLYVISQKFLVAGMTVGAVKG